METLMIQFTIFQRLKDEQHAKEEKKEDEITSYNIHQNKAQENVTLSEWKLNAQFIYTVYLGTN